MMLIRPASAALPLVNGAMAALSVAAAAAAATRIQTTPGPPRITSLVNVKVTSS